MTSPANEPLTPLTSTPASDTDPFEGLTRVEVDLTFEGTTTLNIEPHAHSLSWCVQPNGTDCHSALRVLRPEDRVTISSREGDVLFDGPLSGRFHLLDPVHIYRDIKEHAAPPSGFVIYWSPNGIDPYKWLSLFEGRNKITVHRHSTALVPAEFRAEVSETLKVA